MRCLRGITTLVTIHRRVLLELQSKTGTRLHDLRGLLEEFTDVSDAAGSMMGTSELASLLKQRFPVLASDSRLLHRLFSLFDADGSGAIDFKELVLGWSRMARGSLDDKLDMLFGLYDTDGACGRVLNASTW